MKKHFISGLILVFMCLISVAPALALDTGLGYGTYTGLGTQDLRQGVMEIIRTLLGFLGILALIIILWGGFKWMTSGSEGEGVDEAKKIISAGVVGLTVIFCSYMIASFVITQLTEATINN